MSFIAQKYNEFLLTQKSEGLTKRYKELKI
jgi:hypothetical protein